MCGIAGIVAAELPPGSRSSSEGMHAAIAYRGRDAAGKWSDGRRVVLLHSRLSVIDLDSGSQPMADFSGRFTIVFNGEIYNYLELRTELEKHGARFRTRSDTETILEGYRLLGPAICQRLNGMFAFAIWDAVDCKLFLARDRLGKKPLYWCIHGGSFHFASTCDAFRAIPGRNVASAPASLLLYGHFGFFPEGNTVFSDIFAFPSASHATYLPGGAELRPECYWRLSFAEKSRAPLDHLLEEYSALLADSIRIRLRSDVPIALTFSGGVDSSTIAAICARELGVRPRCYTIDYHTDADPSEETLHAQRVAAHLGLDWHYIHFDYRQRLLDELDAAYAWYDQPCTQLALVYSSKLYETIKPYATVVLSGNGADELFTGYRGDERTRRNDYVLSLFRWLRPILGGLGRLPPHLRLPVGEAYAERMIGRVASTDKSIAGRIACAAQCIAAQAGESGVSTLMDFKMFLSLKHTAADSNFRLPDISGLAGQVEVRSPFLDYRVVEFAARLPDCWKVRNALQPGSVKYLPKRFIERSIPPEIAWSQKKGMGWNLRWGMSAATDPDFRKAFDAAYGALEQAGIDARHYRHAWAGHTEHMMTKGPPSPYGDTMMTGFMLGRWLRLKEGACLDRRVRL
jgi:asparagine synthase (glutamine-hydrolysing)